MLITLFCFSLAVAGEGRAGIELEQKRAAMESIISRLTPETSLEEIAVMHKEIEKISGEVESRIVEIKEEIAQFNLATQQKGIAATTAKSPEVENLVSPEIQRSREEKEVELSEYNLLLFDCQEKLDLLEKARKKRLTRNLVHRGESLVAVVQSAVNSLPQGAGAGEIWRSFLLSEEQRVVLCKRNPEEIAPGYFFMLPPIVILILVLLRNVTHKIVARYGEPGNLLYYLDLFLLSRGVLLNLFIAFSALSVVASWFYLRHDFFALLLCWGVFFLFYMIAAPVGLRVLAGRLRNSKISARDIAVFGDGPFFSALFCLLVTVLVLYASRVLFCIMTPDIFHILRFLLLVISLAALVWVAYIVQRKYIKSSVGRLLLKIAVPGALLLTVLEGAGYRNLMDYLLMGVCETIILLGLLLFFTDLIDLLIRCMATVSDSALSRFVGKEEGAVAPLDNALRMLRFALKLVLYLVFCYLLIAVWGAITQAGAVAQVFSQGIQFGGFSLYPTRLVGGLVILLVGFTAMGFGKQLISWFWLRHTSISHNSRETILTLVGYLGYALLIFVALNTAGFDLTGLSIVLGAFSVGIGFGLQNVFNNFISGLILMFEQPIRRGNWIKVGDEEGYVKKISIRSTVIQTFDKSDVIVPNSDFISSKVINMTLDDTRGRLKIPVGVAYGTDTRLVEELLLKIAQDNPHVISRVSQFRPRVYFLDFGDSSLNFTLNCYLSDINDSLSVRSELNFEIDRVFREHNIEIPFPQREITIKNSGEKQ